MALSKKGKKCTVTVLKPFPFDNSRFNHPVCGYQARMATLSNDIHQRKSVNPTRSKKVDSKVRKRERRSNEKEKVVAVGDE